MQQKFDFLPIIRPNRLPENPDTASYSEAVEVGRFPRWLHRSLPAGPALQKTQEILKKHGLNTVCEEAKCPNRLECYAKKTATFLVLGKECTRACGFCDIAHSLEPSLPDPHEPDQIASSVLELGLTHVVITMVARDDLPDGGAAHLCKIMRKIREVTPQCTIEVLTSDFAGNFEALHIVLDEKPEIFNYNTETIRRLTPKVRHKATYERTMQILSYAKTHLKEGFIKSGLMVGLGETSDEIKETMLDLYQVGCDIITIGQYLQASPKKLKVTSFISPSQFQEWEKYGYEIGLKYIYAGPFVRSSHNAQEILDKTKKQGTL
jgi:lipoic acid synthetase